MMRSLLISALVSMLCLPACDQPDSPPQTPPLSAEALALWEAIPESEKREHGMILGGSRPFGIIVTDFRSATVDKGFSYHILIDQLRPNQRAKWEVMQRLDYSDEQDECGWPAASVTEELVHMNAGDVMTSHTGSRISRLNDNEFVSCSRASDIACRALMRRGRFVMRTQIARARLCEWPALQQEIDAALKVWFPELEASNVQ